MADTTKTKLIVKQSSETDTIAAMKRLITVIQQLFLARSLTDIIKIVRKAARMIARSDGATFILREGNECFYADEDTIRPLWKGKRFPLASCLSGWVMQHKKSLYIKDIYQDARVPQDLYRSSFVKSLLIVPIRTQDPIGAIGNYWSTEHVATDNEIHLLEVLADSTSIAIENLNVYGELEQRVKARTQELESFSYTITHDLRNHLQSILGFTQILLAKFSDQLGEQAKDFLKTILDSSNEMNDLIQNILNLAHGSHGDLDIKEVNLTQLCEHSLARFLKQYPERKTHIKIVPNIMAKGDPGLLQIVFDNLISNAWKYSGKKEEVNIEFGVLSEKTEVLPIYYVKDHGAGFDASNSDQIFQEFHRCHTKEQFPGTGIGLATVSKIVERHHGRIWADSTVNKGTCIYFTLGTDAK